MFILISMTLNRFVRILILCFTVCMNYLLGGFVSAFADDVKTAESPHRRSITFFWMYRTSPLRSLSTAIFLVFV